MKNCVRISGIKNPVNLKVLIENDLQIIHPLSDVDLLDLDKTIHDIRKSLKAILAIFVLFKEQIDPSQYLRWKLTVKSLLKHFAPLRETYVNIQTFNQIEAELNHFNKFNVDIVKNQLKQSYNIIAKEISKRNEIILTGDLSFGKLYESDHELNIYIEPKSLKNRLAKNFKKSERLYKGLTISSSYEEFHQFRKCCKKLYFQHAVLNKIGLEKTYTYNKKLFKLTEYLGYEHDLALLQQYLEDQFKEIAEITNSILTFKTEKLKRKILRLYPKIYYPS